MDDRNGMARGMAEAYMDGSVSVPYALLRTYRALKLSDTEGMILLQLLAFHQLEQNDFPTMEQLQERIGASPSVAGMAVQKLVKQGFVSIDEEFDAVTGIQSERYNLSGLFYKIAALLAAGELPARSGGESAPVESSAQAASRAQHTEHGVMGTAHNIFQLFEQEFGRPLSPMEYETINGWLDQDGYAEELIRFALKESVFAGKLHFRYIDRILLEWSRNRVTNVEEAKIHSQKFRAGR
ncbi:DNA replication protein DnaD [Cohnella kolymensis]|uniref:DNA replication protein DnaD n=1 Tax=Cohnella kolymensis TaxID=1590652 RepID=A0ABR5A162_9BACL|nr:DnaD domain-containing protein [Cohnella kolymensis]KIL34799.1 DNA replication protein DnaD [Cohnella kolymensis]